MEIIDNSRELKGFENIDEDIKLVGYFKNHKSERKNLCCDGMITCCLFFACNCMDQFNFKLQTDLVLKIIFM